MQNLGYLFAAYTFTWITVFAYIYIIARRQRAMEQEIKALRQALERQIDKDD